MNYTLILIGFLVGMLLGVLITKRICDKHLKEMQKKDEDFAEWKQRRHKKFIAELDEIDRVYDEQQKRNDMNRYSVIPNTVNPRVFTNKQGHKIGVYSPAETDRILRSERNENN
ncbi:hypothetical protein [Jeotgalicoccus sp. WY2]|uniref:hypothetical protein n=1 Tax=Jeotgalicoccus sp. WY2 TaxID=2708346 RepID=UPI001BD37DA6|nr:hypothetical protein [Jeotgalicoccus sp. WY2]